MAHGLSCSAACGIFPDQGSNPCPLHWQADSYPLRHQGSPEIKWSWLHVESGSWDIRARRIVFSLDETAEPGPSESSVLPPLLSRVLTASALLERHRPSQNQSRTAQDPRVGRGMSMQPLSSGHTHLLAEQRVQNHLPGPHFLLAAPYSRPSSIFTRSKPLSLRYCSYFRKYVARPAPGCCRPATPRSRFRSLFQNGCRGHGPPWSFWEADPEPLTGVRPAPGPE